MAHSAIEFEVTEYSPAEAVTGALTAGDGAFATGPDPADGSVLVYKTQPTIDDLQHAAKQLLPKPTSSDFAQNVEDVIGTSLKATVKKGKKLNATQAAVWAGNVRRLVREIARSGKATARAAGKKTASTGGKAAFATRGRKGAGGDNDPVNDLVGTHSNQQSPTIGIQIKPLAPGDADAYFAPAQCAVFRNPATGSTVVNINGGLDTIPTPPSGTATGTFTAYGLIGITTADGVESSRGKIYEQLQYTSMVTTGVVSLLCPPARARVFKAGDIVYVDRDATVKLRRKPEVEVATYTYKTGGDQVGRFIEMCGPHGGIRVKLDILMA